jgi:cobalt-zinc-cadmium efflux system outer membrane protein
MKFNSFRKYILFSVLLALVAVSGSMAAEPRQTGDRALSAYISESWKTHPDLESARALITAEASRTEMSSSWKNPGVSFGLMNAPQNFDLHQEPMTMWQIGVMQEIPVPGKLSASSRAGELRTKAAVASLDEARYRMASLVSAAYYDLAAAIQVRKLLQTGQDLAEQMTDAASARVSSGIGSQADVLRAQSEVERWSVELTNNQANVEQKRAALAYAVGRSDAARIADPQLPDSLPPEIDLDAALNVDSLDHTPEVARVRLQDDATRADVRRAKLDYWPNPTLGLKYGLREYLRKTNTSEMTGITTTSHMPQDAMISIELSAPLPLFYKGNQRAQIEELSALQSERQAEVAKARLDKQQELRDLAAQRKAAVDGYRIEQERLVPQVLDTWRALLIDYREGKVPFTSLSEGQISVVKAQMDVIMHMAQGWTVYREWQTARGEGTALVTER